jgi:hypothetical protein
VRHLAASSFWECYEKLPKPIQRLADKNFQILKTDQRHPSIHLKKSGRFWSARVGIRYRALGVAIEDGIIWVWIGTHAEYDKLVGS